MAHKKTLGQILIQKNLVSPDKIEKALHVQAGGRRRIGYILIKMGVISEKELFSALAEQKNIPVADLKTDVSQEALSVLPRYWLRNKPGQYDKSVCYDIPWFRCPIKRQFCKMLYYPFKWIIKLFPKQSFSCCSAIRSFCVVVVDYC